jgi:uracil-DNA glycosylase
MIDLTTFKKIENEKLEPWYELMKPVFESEAWEVLIKKIKSDIVQKGEHMFNPRLENVWRVFEKTKVDGINCIIIGQDPYPVQAHTTGIPFGIPESSEMIPLSLQNIEAELNRMGHLAFLTMDVTLDSWVKQGVFMINSAMTTLYGYKNSGCHLKEWQPVVQKFIEFIVFKNPGIPIIAMGAVAKKTVTAYTRQYCPVIEVPHPANARYDNVGLLGSNCFYNANLVLTDPTYGLLRKPILWHADLRHWPDYSRPDQEQYDNPPF